MTAGITLPDKISSDHARVVPAGTTSFADFAVLLRLTAGRAAGKRFGAGRVFK